MLDEKQAEDCLPPPAVNRMYWPIYSRKKIFKRNGVNIFEAGNSRSEGKEHFALKLFMTFFVSSPDLLGDDEKTQTFYIRTSMALSFCIQSRIKGDLQSVSK